MGESFYQQVHRLRDGDVLVYQRADTSQGGYRARLKVPGVSGYIVRSLKTRDLRTALNTAEDMFYALKAEQKLGMDVRVSGNLKFKDLWKRFYAAHENGLSIHRQRLHKFMAKKYFNPFFGEARVNDMPDAFVEKYWDWRVNYHNPENWEDDEDIPANAARIPAQKTLDMEARMLRQIFRWGKRIGFVKREPWIKALKVKHTKGVERRPSFDETEWKTIYTHLRQWAKEALVVVPGKQGGKLQRSGPNAMQRYQREVIRDYLLFMANSGLRPNEARQLRWRDLRIEKDTENKPALVVEVAPTTKTGARVVVCRGGTQVYTDRLKKISRHAGPDDLVFASYDGEPVEDFNKTFAAILTKLKLLDDRWGKRRTIYSLRHFYCTQCSRVFQSTFSPKTWEHRSNIFSSTTAMC